MSIRNAIANCKKPIGSGLDRDAFYSKKYNLIFKRRRPDREGWGDEDDQCAREVEFFDQMCLSDKEVFPMVGYESVKGKLTVIMKKCTPVLQICPHLSGMVDDEDDEYILKVGKIIGTNEYSNNHVMFFIDDYTLSDIHLGNLAVDEDNNLVIIDVGRYKYEW